MYCIGDIVEVVGGIKGLRWPATIGVIKFANTSEERLVLVLEVAAKYVKPLTPEIIKEPASCEKNI